MIIYRFNLKNQIVINKSEIIINNTKLLGRVCIKVNIFLGELKDGKNISLTR
jgi:hypothetical protein